MFAWQIHPLALRVPEGMKIKTSSKHPIKLVAFTLVAALTSACQTTASGPRVQTVMSADAPFARYHTFSFGLAESAPSGSYVSPASLEAEHALRPLVGDALARKGYAENAGQADFVVRLGAGGADVANSSTEGFFSDDFGGGQVTPGLSVAIDMYDAASGAHVWHGATVITLDRGRLGDKLLEHVVASAFAEFPRRDPAAAPQAAN
jgi:hypothetical protein